MEELKNKLVEDCNNSGLPLEAVYYLVKDLYRDVCDTYNEMLEREKKQKELQAARAQLLEFAPQNGEVEVEETTEE